MSTDAPPAGLRAALHGCYVLSLRPRGDHAGMRRAAATHGARVLALSPWRLQRHDDEATVHALQSALSAPSIVVTSPAAVAAAAALQPLRGDGSAQWLAKDWFAIGSGTAAALRRAGIDTAIAPTRMDSEGLLALPRLQQIDGTRIGLVSGRGGRGLIAQALHARGAQVLRADVYARIPQPLSARALQSLRALDAPIWLALGSGDALQHLLAQLPADAGDKVRQARVVAASARLASLAQATGFEQVVVAASARPRDLMDAAAHAALAS